MHVAITGAAGFVGSHLCEALAAAGHQVTGIDCLSPYYSTELKQLNVRDICRAGVTFHQLDLAEDDLTDTLKDVEVIFHLAAQPGISATTLFEDYLRNNIIATQRLLEAAQQLDSLECFINIATSSVYGKHATDPEDTAPKPTSHYGVTKLTAEQLVMARCRDEGFPACSLRLFSVYGERERPEKLYPKLIHSILADQPFPLFEGSKEHSRSFTYVGDIVKGFMAVMDNLSKARGEIFNIGSDVEITTGEGMAIVEEALGKKAEIDHQPPRPGDQLRTHADITKAREILGYQPETEPREGLAREVEWYRDRIFGKIQVY
ncbi:MAG: NAD-dependent epimerase/dehydratase family protein [Candidatus Sumerlaeota bacterium]